MITSEQYRVSKQTMRERYIKIELLNRDMQVLDEIQGDCVGGNITFDNNTDMRRSCYVEMVVTNGDYEVAAGSRIFLNRLIKIYVGERDLYTGEIVWFNEGVYVIDEPSYRYSADTHGLTFYGLDMMSLFTGDRDGYIQGEETVIPQGSSVRDAIITTITQFGNIRNYVVEECQMRNGEIQEVPFDIQLTNGATIFSILQQLRDILPYYQIYFDTDGIFHYEQIPTEEDEPVIADDDVIMENLVSEQVITDFKSIKNVIEVYGHTWDAPYYASEVNLVGNIIVLTIEGLTPVVGTLPYNDGQVVAFVCPELPQEYGSLQMIWNENRNVPFVNYNHESIPASYLQKDELYVVRYDGGINSMVLMGHNQIYAIAEDKNPESPFNVEATGIIRLPLYGGEYSNIQSDYLAQERADWELYQRTRLQQSMTLYMSPIWYFDVNQIVLHRPREIGEEKKYLIQRITYGLSVEEQSTIALQSYQSYWNTFRKEPKYRNVESLNFDGTQCLDTGYVPSYKTRVKVYGNFDGSVNNGCIFGCVGGTYQSSVSDEVQDDYSFGVTIEDANTFATTMFDKTATINTSTSGYFVVDKNKNKFVVNDITAETEYTPFQYMSYPLFVMANNNQGEAEDYLTGDINHIQIWNNEVLVRDFIVVVDSDNVLCFYEKVNNNFYHLNEDGVYVVDSVDFEQTPTIGSTWVYFEDGEFVPPFTGTYKIEVYGGGGSGNKTRYEVHIDGGVNTGVYVGGNGGGGSGDETTMTLTEGVSQTVRVGKGGVDSDGEPSSFGSFVVNGGKKNGQHSGSLATDGTAGTETDPTVIEG